MTKDLRAQYEQIQAAINLFAVTRVDAPVPPLRGWAVSPDALLLLVGELLRSRPALVVECGSGSSTLWLALAIKQHGLATRIVSLEHDPAFKLQTEQLLERHGVDALAEVRLAPLVQSGLTNHETPWYDQSATDDLVGIGLLFIDGPPEATGPLARYPALPLLFDRLTPDAVVLLDDAGRQGERSAVASWLDAFPDLEAEHIQSEKGTAILRRAPR